VLGSVPCSLADALLLSNGSIKLVGAPREWCSTRLPVAGDVDHNVLTCDQLRESAARSARVSSSQRRRRDCPREHERRADRPRDSRPEIRLSENLTLGGRRSDCANVRVSYRADHGRLATAWSPRRSRRSRRTHEEKRSQGDVWSSGSSGVAARVRKGKRRASASLVLTETSVRRQELRTVWLPNARELHRLGRGPLFAGVDGSSAERARPWATVGVRCASRRGSHADTTRDQCCKSSRATARTSPCGTSASTDRGACRLPARRAPSKQTRARQRLLDSLTLRQRSRPSSTPSRPRCRYLEER
jgi:hypothetical protein